MKTPPSSPLSRRSFVRKSAQSAAAFTAGFLGLRHYANASGAGAAMATVDRYGPLQSDPHRILDLPKGFSYRVISRTGDRMDDGLVVPGYIDGMGAFRGPGGEVILVRNHELESKGEGEKADTFRRLGPFGTTNQLFSKVDPSKLYDAGGSGTSPSLGGTSTLVYDPESQKTLREFLSVAGTERNCAGGVTPWGTWITCEETNVTPDGEFLEDHGYAFEVRPTLEPELQKAVPFKEMGRFRREAVAVDPRTGIVYQTEDMGDGLFYRFLPKVREDLSQGGKVQALAIVDQGKADTRNWPDSKGSGFEEGREYRVEWIDMTDVESPKDDLRFRGHQAGAALFARGEGIWYGDGVIYFACTNGGGKKLGQIFKYTPGQGEADAAGVLELFIESTDGNVIASADNLTIAPWGDLIVCEDRKQDSHLRGVTPEGRIYTFGRNALNGMEFAGACFAPGISTMFVNIQKPGLTLAIDGPWEVV